MGQIHDGRSPRAPDEGTDVFPFRLGQPSGYVAADKPARPGD